MSMYNICPSASPSSYSHLTNAKMSVIIHNILNYFPKRHISEKREGEEEGGGVKTL